MGEAINEIVAAGIEVPQANGTIRRVSEDRLRQLSADVAIHLAERFGPEKLGAVFEELLHATHITNGGREIPDNRVRLSAATWLGDHTMGKAIERKEITAGPGVGESDAEVLARLLQSPALVANLREMLAKAGAVEVGSVTK